MQVGKLLFSYEGQITRKPFIVGFLILLGFSFVFGLITTMLGLGIDTSAALAAGILASPLYMVFLVIVLYAEVCLIIKRLRDVGWTPWLALLVFIPAVQLIFIIILMIVPSKTTVLPPQ